MNTYKKTVDENLKRSSSQEKTYIDEMFS